ncbi:MAG TPA: M24 family metallopeptidase [Gemmatimonadales bacterium]|nr:M24 family metallopeptidase [Gemmatimonadales bacterium]
MIDLTELREALREADLDGWLLFAFKGLNPVATRVLGLSGLNTRRLFALFPRHGEPVVIAHKIELQGLENFPGKVVPYARWSELNQALSHAVAGKTLGMEISPRNAVPYLDRVPHGVVQLLQSMGAKILPSGDLVSRFAARWSQQELADHHFAAEILADVARSTLRQAIRETGALTETALQARVIATLEGRGLVLNEPPIVGFGPNSAKPHYEPHPGKDAVLRPGDLVLLDLWAGRSLDTVFADQTWIGFAGSHLPPQVAEVWRTVRRARDAAIDAIREASAEHRSIAGYEADQAARAVVSAAGYGDAFVHRTGHSIDRDLHGSGPHLDDYETHDDRVLLPGVGFSVEPGIYLPGSFGIRSEVNVFMDPSGPVVTPREPQREVIVGGDS